VESSVTIRMFVASPGRFECGVGAVTALFFVTHRFTTAWAGSLTRLCGSYMDCV